MVIDRAIRAAVIATIRNAHRADCAKGSGRCERPLRGHDDPALPCVCEQTAEAIIAMIEASK